MAIEIENQLGLLMICCDTKVSKKPNSVMAYSSRAWLGTIWILSP